MRPTPRDIAHLRGPFLVRAALTGKRAIVAQMADDLRLLSASTGSIVADDMELLGWLPSQINLHGAEARRRAQSLSLRAA